MKNRNFGDLQQPLPTTASREAACPLPVTLLEPLLQGFDKPSRFFIHYFSTHVCSTLVLRDGAGNPYRGIIPYTGSPVVKSAMIAVASCHYIQSITGCPLAGLLVPGTKATASFASKNHVAGRNYSQEALLQGYLRSKGYCLRAVSTALAINGVLDAHGTILIAVVLLIVLDVFENGSSTWNIHLVGAEKLLENAVTTGAPDWHSSLRNLFNEMTIFQVFGSSLAKPGALTSASTLPSTWNTSTEAVTPIGCPIDILMAIEIFASHRRLDSLFESPTGNVKALEYALNTIRSYDIVSWSLRVAADEPQLPADSLTHLGAIWKLSAEIYACCTTRSLLTQEPPPVSALIAEYAFFERDCDESVKCLIWPTFVAGASSTNPEDRAWVLKTLDRIWRLGHCANTRNAAQILELLWQKHDRKILQTSPVIQPSETIDLCSPDHADWDWINELSQLKGSWLFI
ncbi:Acriflavine sensitivity control protein acr-2 [Paramyrothecium foliicola]|nr:Acriflavine sensitivity control protein acr-2 [Paramyrothecium foliicola]